MWWGLWTGAALPLGADLCLARQGFRAAPAWVVWAPEAAGPQLHFSPAVRRGPGPPAWMPEQLTYPHRRATSPEVHRTHLWAGFPSLSFPLEPVDLTCWLCPISRCGRGDLTLQQLMGGATGLSWGGIPTAEAMGSGHDLSPHDLREGPWELPPHAPGEGPHDLSPYVPGEGAWDLPPHTRGLCKAGSQAPLFIGLCVHLFY